MTKLERFLKSIAVSVVESETTNSIYYELPNECKIRVSDHYSEKDGFDLQIIHPRNGGYFYLVTLPNSFKFLSWNAKQIIEFIPNLLILKDLQVKSVKPVVKTREQAKKEFYEIEWDGKLRTSQIKASRCKACYRDLLSRSFSPWTVEEVNTFREMLIVEFGTNKGINDDFQIFLTCTPLTYRQALSIYKIVILNYGIEKPTIEMLTNLYSQMN
jgi:hypothetical protein